ncbi:hypothetical protein MTO96_000746 [Rhipicephalus appendiculatus]
MPSTTAASQPVASIVALLPPEVWTLIFWHMDIETLSNMCEAVPQLQSLAFSPIITQIVRTDPATSFRKVLKFPQQTRKGLVLGNHVTDVSISVDVRQLHFTECLTLPSRVIITCARSCSKLRELYCVNCLVEPDKLFDLLSGTLQSLEKLEWSLHHYDYYDTKLDGNIIDRVRSYRKSEGPRLRSMYVEVVVTHAAVHLLEVFLPRCSMLRNLQVHAVLRKPTGASSSSTDTGLSNTHLLALQNNLRGMQDLKVLKYSCELDLPLDKGAQMEEHPEPHRLYSPEDLIRYNFSASVEKPEATPNVAWLSDVLTQKKYLRSFEQATVCLEANSEAPSLFVQAAASSEYWNHIKRLTLALSTSEKAVSPSHPPEALGCYMNPMRQFFETCVSQITELNLTAFHFGIECDGCNLVASTLPKLRALALPPCGIACSLQSLADGCALLEHIDVRASSSRYAASACSVCRLPLRFTSRTFELLQKKTRLRRLSIDETAPIRNLMFLADCRVEELRLSLDNVSDENLAECPTELGERLAQNTRLASLTLVARRASLSNRLAKTLWPIQSLHHLCILTMASHARSEADDFFRSLESRMPRLLSAHAHYVCDSENVQRSWKRQRRGCCCAECDEGLTPSPHGVHLVERPCMGRLCCVDTFIGLVRPRNRY